MITIGEPSELETRILKEIERAINDAAPLSYRILELVMKHRQEILDTALVLKFGDLEVRKCSNWYEIWNRGCHEFMKNNGSFCMTFDEAMALVKSHTVG